MVEGFNRTFRHFQMTLRGPNLPSCTSRSPFSVTIDYPLALSKLLYFR